jgi:hypothetical protein
MRTNGPFRLDEHTSYKRVDLVNCSPHQFCEVLALAAKIGVTDAMTERKSRTRNELAVMLATEHRVGHARALKAAYSAGRFHVEMMGKD